MKNIHILSTDKPSRLYKSIFWDLKDKQKLKLTNVPIYKNSAFIKYNIYITSDEEIKEGDWYITTLDNEIYKANSSTIIIMNDANKFPHTTYRNTHFKIVLTDNKDLIKDGVQAIDDEFLEWFVKNPSCELVNIRKVANGVKNHKLTYEYKIIIPKEEQKSLIEKMKPLQEQWQKDMDSVLNPKEESELKCDFCKRYPRLEGTNKCESCYSVVRHFLEQDPKFKDKLLPDLRKKQETLEEAAEKLYPIHKMYFPKSVEDLNKIPRSIFISGAKWQAERMYSEEDMRKSYIAGLSNFKKRLSYNLLESELSFEEWFEQFKKK